MAVTSRFGGGPTSVSVATGALAEALAAMANEPYRVEGSNADTAQSAFIEAEGLCYVLDEAADPFVVQDPLKATRAT